jgi:hypothetical protein
LIPDFGVRVRLDHVGWLHFAIPARLEPESLDVTVETLRRDVILEHHWLGTQSPPEMFVDVANGLRGTSAWEGDGAYDPGGAFRNLADLLESTHDAVRQGRSSEGRTFQIIEAFRDEGTWPFEMPDWLVTADRIVPRDRQYYDITYDRFHELDWDEHLRHRDWVDVAAFRQAWDVAESLIRSGVVEGRLRRKAPVTGG